MTSLLIASLAWAAVVAFGIVRADRLAHRYLDTKEAKQPRPPVDIPPDLQAAAMNESEAWAQDQALATIRERYDQYKDWNKVRAAIGIGTL